MTEQGWPTVPVGLDADQWMTRSTDRTVLAIANSVVSAQRLDDVVGLVETDLRVQVIFTKAPGVFNNGVSSLFQSWAVSEIPWELAVRERFDLAVTASYRGIERIHAPIMVMSHGAGNGKRVPAQFDVDDSAHRPVYGLDAGRLMHDGRLIPSSILLSHQAQLRVLAAQCPPAAAVAVVAGDPCTDRLAVSAPNRAAYRAAIGLHPAHKLVLFASTWGRKSLFNKNIEIIFKAMRELDPRRYRVGTLLHPAVAFGHGMRQIRAWLAEARAAGLVVVEPHLDWRVPMLAADYLIGDHGSSSVYGAALGIPVLHNGAPADELDPRSPQAWLAKHTPLLVPNRPLLPQLRAATRAAGRAWRDAVRDRLTSRPGHAHRIIRGEMYRLLKLSVPGRHRAAEPIPLPDPTEGAAWPARRMWG